MGIQKILGLFLVSLLLTIAAPGIQAIEGARAIAQTPPVSVWVDRGIERYDAGNYPEAIALWERALSDLCAGRDCSSSLDAATIHTNLGRAYRTVGELDRAIAQWESAYEIYRQQPHGEGSDRALAAAIADRAQAYNDLGQHQRAIELLTEALEYGIEVGDPAILAGIRGSLGNAHWGAGDYEAAIENLSRSLDDAREAGQTDYASSALNNLGNVYLSRSDRLRYQANVAELEGDIRQARQLEEIALKDLDRAREAFEGSLAEAKSLGGIAQVHALLNLNRVLHELAPTPMEREAIATAIAQNRDRAAILLADEPDSRDKAFALINLATSGDAGEWPGSDNSDLLEQAIAIARRIGDRRAESFALGSLGRLNEVNGDRDRAMELTREAQFAAQQVSAADSLYRWQWQAGRLLVAQGKPTQAIGAYREAIATLQSIRSDILAANPDIQFDFRDSVEPIYRELIALLLDRDPETAVNVSFESTQSPSTVREALDVLELLKLAELRNFFGDDCVEVARDGANDAIDPQAAIAYSVILGDRTELILDLPGDRPGRRRLTRHPVEISAAQLQQEIDRLRQLLEKRATDEYLPQSQTVYDWLVRPLEADLNGANVQTILFIQDGVLRKIPMAALHDGERFLIEKYAIATTPSLKVTSNSPLRREGLRSLTLGLSVERPPFAPLTNVKAEVTEVNQILGGSKLLDEEFTLERLRQQLEKGNYPIVHMATHGKFGADANNTFLLAFDNRITIEQLDNLLRAYRTERPVELLTLSACQTAAGDDRSALGIAGVAVRAGVNSALATLWFINDQATVELIEEFYRQLLQRPEISKAEALRQAQLKLIGILDYSHPAVWSPFILIGNWQ
ncbi:MAG: CHAT domain-containing protein [Cyanobacteria bacterium J007]|nr:MAG: CHAT domain-containing protein [Cyanobacteria bacterium J007]